MELIEGLIRFLVGPLILAGFSMPFMGLLDVAVSAGVYFTVAIIWFVIINGGFLILDGDLDLFD